MPKKELRTRLRAVLAEITADALADRSRRAAQILFKQPEYRNAETMMIYLSLPHEADTTAIVLQAWQEGKRVVAPQISWESRQMIPVEIRDLAEDVSEGQLGIREPIRGMPIPTPQIELVIVPGLGFDLFGNRLGRGRGFYDRFLGKADFRGVACGFALECQVVDSLPAAAHDMRVAMLVTEETVRRFGR